MNAKCEILFDLVTLIFLFDVKFRAIFIQGI